MIPSVTLLGREIPAYWLCAMFGVCIAGLVAVFRRKRFEELQNVDLTNSAALCLVGGLVGAKVLSILTLLPQAVEALAQNRIDGWGFASLLVSGMVYYGGLFGALAALWLYGKHYRLPMASLFDFYAPLIALFHVFGRVGCFLAGCCHGIESARCGIAYSHSALAPNHVPLFPVQLAEAAGELILFGVLVLFERNHHRQGKTLPLYLGLYAVLRFGLEFLRGDAVRGIWFGLSSSQWISLLVLLWLGTRRLRRRKH